MYIKLFDELTFQDNFIFQKVMLKKHICKAVLERLLDISIKDIVYIHEEKNLAVRWDSNSVRRDVFVMDDKGTGFNMEMQTSKDLEELVIRTRFYQSILDMYHIQKGQKYTTLNDSYVIFICTFPVFTGNRHKYTFKNVCIEDHDIALNDGATKLFLSTKGTQNDVSKPLQAFLDYIDGQEATDELLRDIDDAVYSMLSMDHYKYCKEGMAEGIAEGLAQGKAEVVIQMLQEKLSLEMIARLTKLTVEQIKEIGRANALL